MAQAHSLTPAANGSEGHNLTRTQQQLNAALFNTDSEALLMSGCANGGKYALGSNRNSTGIVEEDANDRELHMAEQLVANADRQQKSAFQFDTIEPKGRHRAGAPNAQAVALNLMQDSGIGKEEKEEEENCGNFNKCTKFISRSGGSE